MMTSNLSSASSAPIPQPRVVEPESSMVTLPTKKRKRSSSSVSLEDEEDGAAFTLLSLHRASESATAALFAPVEKKKKRRSSESIPSNGQSKAKAPEAKEKAFEAAAISDDEEDAGVVTKASSSSTPIPLPERPTLFELNRSTILQDLLKLRSKHVVPPLSHQGVVVGMQPSRSAFLPMGRPMPPAPRLPRCSSSQQVPPFALH